MEDYTNTDETELCESSSEEVITELVVTMIKELDHEVNEEEKEELNKSKEEIVIEKKVDLVFVDEVFIGLPESRALIVDDNVTTASDEGQSIEVDLIVNVDAEEMIFEPKDPKEPEEIKESKEPKDPEEINEPEEEVPVKHYNPQFTEKKGKNSFITWWKNLWNK